MPRPSTFTAEIAALNDRIAALGYRHRFGLLGRTGLKMWQRGHKGAIALACKQPPVVRTLQLSMANATQ